MNTTELMYYHGFNIDSCKNTVYNKLYKVCTTRKANGNVYYRTHEDIYRISSSIRHNMRHKKHYYLIEATLKKLQG